MMTEVDFDNLWERIKALAGEEFSTKSGRRTFTYTIEGGTLFPDHTDRAIGWGNFLKALEMEPLDGPGEISDVVQGSSYVWAILHDKRIRPYWP